MYTRLLVTGSRHVADKMLVYDGIREVLCSVGYSEEMGEDFSDLIVAQGGATGADSFAVEFCHKKGIQCVTYEAQWDKFGKAAGIMRNEYMFDDFDPDIVIAFPLGEWRESRGTFHMITYAFNNSKCAIHIFR